MFQTIQNRNVFVVDLPEFPVPMPITALQTSELQPYAVALTKAIEDGLVTKPGKYAIEVNHVLQTYMIFQVNE